MRQKPLVIVVLISVLAAASAGLSACGRAPQAVPTPSSEQMDVEEPAVYAALVKDMFPADMLVIRDTTATDPGGTGNLDQTLQHVLANMHTVAPATVDSFRARNDRPYPLAADLQLGTKYVLLSQADMDALFNVNQDGWQMFYERYPDADGILTLSRVGFNSSMDQALVYAGSQSHYLAGAGYFFLLEKVNGAWMVDQKVMTWIS